MRIRLISLTMEHFKGFDRYQLRLDGNDANIYGANATGKTTLFDAYSWVLFGTDSANTPNFSPKPFGSDGRETHNLETRVVAELVTDAGKRATLTKTMAEDWVKQRGETDRTFKGNVYGYFINDTPVSKADYDTYVKGIATQDVFRMITNPQAFNALDWKKRRQMLVDISGADVDGILLERPEYAELSDALCEREIDLDDLRKATDAQRKRLNGELERIPVQIAEVRRMDAGASDAGLNQAIARREALLAEIAGIDAQLSDVSAVLKRQEDELSGIAHLKAQRSDLERAIADAGKRAQMDAQRELVRLRADLRDAKARRDTYAATLEGAKADHARAVAETDGLRAKWSEVFGQLYTESADTGACPHCGQRMPDGLCEQAERDARARWQSAKDESLAKIKADGQSAKRNADNLAMNVQLIESRIREQDAIIADLEPRLASATEAADQPAAEPDFAADIRHAALTAQINERERMLGKARDEGPAASLTAERRTKMDQIADCDQIIARQEQHERNAARIEELTQAQRAVGAQLADTERLLILIERFVTDRCKALEESINALFETVRWKLFDVQINTGIKDTCVCMIPSGGPNEPMVPYPDANNAAKVNAGLEIIDVLSRYYEASVPVMIDNAESVNRLRRIDAQRIALFVSEDAAMVPQIMDKAEVA